MSTSERVWSELRDRYGDGLRSVIRYHPLEFEAHMRADLRPRYSETDIQAFVDEAILDQLALESKIDDVDFGRFHGFVRIFDDVWLFIWPDRLDQKSGFILTLQRDDPSLGLDAVEEIDDYLTEEVGPEL
mgnify:CR=1 FL=1